MNRKALKGFTLIELIMVITIIGILAVSVGGMVTHPIEGFFDLKGRARLVDTAETALRRVTREVRLALPNSVRVSTSPAPAIEFLRTLDGGRYRAEADGSDNDACAAPDDDVASLGSSQDCFEILGTLSNAGRVDAGGSGRRSECLDGTVDCLAIYNTGQTGANAYAGDNLAAITAVSANSMQFDNSADTPGFSYPFSSPSQRLFVVDTPVSFICAGGQVTRYAGYTIAGTQPNPPSGGTASLLVDNVSACSFSYDPGTATRGGLVTLSLTLTSQGESITLIEQIHVRNVP